MAANQAAAAQRAAQEAEAQTAAAQKAAQEAVAQQTAAQQAAQQAALSETMESLVERATGPQPRRRAAER